MEPVIRLNNVSKQFKLYEKPLDRLKEILRPSRQHYQQFWALRNISFEVPKGKTIGIVGRNGSGKSTLLQIIAGTLQPTSGQITVNGRISALLELGSGFNPDFTGRQNIFINGNVIGLSKRFLEEKFDEIVQFSEIPEFIDQPVRTYSSGMLVRLAFSLAIAANPDVLIVDEALSVGDEAFQRKCFARIHALQEKGATILFVSHSQSEIVSLCDWAILIDQSELLLIESPKTIIGYYQKLIYSSPSSQHEVRAEIARLATDNQRLDLEKSLGGNTSDDSSVEFVSGDSNVISSGLSQSKNLADYIESSQEGANISASADVEVDHVRFLPRKSLGKFDQDFLSKSILIYESHGAIIKDPKILDLDGNQVNILVRRNTYVYCYDVDFTSNQSFVRFGMVIKGKNGFELGGASSHTIHQLLENVKSGTRCRVTFRFSCLLNSGVYFLNAGILNESNGFIHRITDAVIFRVEAEPDDSSRSGLVDFLIDPNVNILLDSAEGVEDSLEFKI